MLVEAEVCRFYEWILELWEQQVAEIYTLVDNLATCPSRQVVVAEIDKASKRPPRVNISLAFANAVARLSPNLDSEELADRHFDDVQQRIGVSCVLPAGWDQELERIANDIVLEHIAACPISGEWLIQQGIPQGPDLGKWKISLCAEWEQIRGVVATDFLESCAERIRNSQAIGPKPSAASGS